MEIISPGEVKVRLDLKAKGEFTALIEQLPAGGALRIGPGAWNRRESIYHFFLTRYKGQVSVRRLSDGFYVIKRPSAS